MLAKKQAQKQAALDKFQDWKTATCSKLSIAISAHSNVLGCANQQEIKTASEITQDEPLNLQKFKEFDVVSADWQELCENK